ncbi:hypothetical protein M3G00_07900 [Brevibacterium casei]|uniref:hypothetical protein n=1 Tax=Brevibacterium casei TaxID=33889 RepID=UPI00223B6194|nr:hypothetical protein [Brevibacterium casei]MCT2182858.1 hypothetical protein [Brevibacterium casei]
MNRKLGFEQLKRLDMRDLGEHFQAMIDAMQAIRYPTLMWQRLPLRATCKLCGERYEASMLIDVDRICPDCNVALVSIAEKIGRTMSVTDLARLADRSSRWTGQAIRYGRPWQDHVPAHNRHLLNEQP